MEQVCGRERPCFGFGPVEFGHPGGDAGRCSGSGPLNLHVVCEVLRLISKVSVITAASSVCTVLTLWEF